MSKVIRQRAVVSGLICLFCFSVGLFLLYGIYDSLKLNRRAEPTTGTVQSSEVRYVPANDDFTLGDDVDPIYKPVVTYRYTYDGQTFTNANLSSTRVGTMSRSQAASIVQKLPEGENVTVYVLPEAPARSFLVKGNPLKEDLFIKLFLPGVFLLFGVLGGIGFVRVIRGEN